MVQYVVLNTLFPVKLVILGMNTYFPVEINLILKWWRRCIYTFNQQEKSNTFISYPLLGKFLWAIPIINSQCCITIMAANKLYFLSYRIKLIISKLCWGIWVYSLFKGGLKISFCYQISILISLENQL